MTAARTTTAGRAATGASGRTPRRPRATVGAGRIAVRAATVVVAKIAAPTADIRSVM
jgi:hypothetical protein